MASRPDHVALLDRDAAVRFSRRLSVDHRREIGELGGVDPVTAVVGSLDASLEAYAYTPPGRPDPVFVVGVEPKGALTGAAMVWMLATADIAGHKKDAVRVARWGLERAFSVTGATLVEQYIPPWYATGLRFAAHLGFSLELSRAGSRRGPVAVRVFLTRERHTGLMTKRKHTWAL